MNRIARAIAVTALMSGISMSATASPPPSAPLVGVWSGDRVTLTLTPEGGELVADCATSVFAQPVRVDAGGRFAVSAGHVESSGGPMHVDETRSAVPPTAALKGRVSGATLALEVNVPGRPAAHYALTPGIHHKRVRCL